jgi:hypothetical protein
MHEMHVPLIVALQSGRWPLLDTSPTKPEPDEINFEQKLGDTWMRQSISNSSSQRSVLQNNPSLL